MCDIGNKFYLYEIKTHTHTQNKKNHNTIFSLHLNVTYTIL